MSASFLVSPSVGDALQSRDPVANDGSYQCGR
jgi:hypothetical protein